jgi:hypothetical protein
MTYKNYKLTNLEIASTKITHSVVLKSQNRWKRLHDSLPPEFDASSYRDEPLSQPGEFCSSYRELLPS